MVAGWSIPKNQSNEYDDGQYRHDRGHPQQLSDAAAKPVEIAGASGDHSHGSCIASTISKVLVDPGFGERWWFNRVRF
jgi:hypothetical protein